MELQLKQQGTYAFDEVSMGEILLRLDPGEGRIKTARHFAAWEGGGEYNVARGLRKCFGMKTSVITAFTNNEVGRLLEDMVSQGGVDTSLIRWLDFDGIGRSSRNAINFTERGFGIRGAVGCSDRANTAVSHLGAQDYDFDYIFGTLGARWFHTGGIYAAISEKTNEAVIEAIKTAKKYGTIVSYDLNYRPSMWKSIGGKARAQEVNREIAKYVDVMIGNEEDFTAWLGFEIEGNDKDLKSLNLEGYKRMVGEAAKTYPNFKAVATTLRTVKTATRNDWGAMCWCDGEVYLSQKYNDLEILDRVGKADGRAGQNRADDSGDAVFLGKVVSVDSLDAVALVVIFLDNNLLAVDAAGSVQLVEVQHHSVADRNAVLCVVTGGVADERDGDFTVGCSGLAGFGGSGLGGGAFSGLGSSGAGLSLRGAACHHAQQHGCRQNQAE